MAHMDAFNGVRRTEPIVSCVVLVHAQSYYLDYLLSGFPDPSANQHGTYVPHTLPSNYTRGE